MWGGSCLSFLSTPAFSLPFSGEGYNSRPATTGVRGPPSRDRPRWDCTGIILTQPPKTDHRTTAGLGRGCSWPATHTWTHWCLQTFYFGFVHPQAGPAFHLKQHAKLAGSTTIRVFRIGKKQKYKTAEWLVFLPGVTAQFKAGITEVIKQHCLCDMISQVAKSICHLHRQIELILHYRLWGLYNINVITSSGLQTWQLTEFVGINRYACHKSIRFTDN